MEVFRPQKGLGLVFLSLTTIIVDAVIFILIYLSNTYELRYALMLLLIVFTIYDLYYILGGISLKYELCENNLTINRLWGIRKITVPISCMKAYKIQEYNKKEIEGLKISGCFAKGLIFGKAIIDKIGTTYMFVTNSKNVIYIDTEKINYCISPINITNFKDKLEENNIKDNEFTDTGLKSVSLHKEKKYLVIIILIAVLLIVIPSISMVYYLMDKLPLIMPLSFDKNFIAVKFGTAKQFVFKQIIYGVLNMAIFFCFYFASSFFQKYDRRTAYNYLYLGTGICLLIMIFQMKVFFTFV